MLDETAGSGASPLACLSLSLGTKCISLVRVPDIGRVCVTSVTHRLSLQRGGHSAVSSAHSSLNAVPCAKAAWKRCWECADVPIGRCCPNSSVTFDIANWCLATSGEPLMLTVMLGLASLLTACALGFVVGRVWEIRQEIRQDIRSKAGAQSARPTRTPAASQLINRFLGGTF